MSGADEVRRFLLKQIPEHPGDIASIAAERFDISRQAVNRHLRRLTAEGRIRAHGATRARTYELVVRTDEHFVPLDPEPQEDRVWRELVLPHLGEVSDNAREICQYGFTEIVNNAVDHSEGARLRVAVAVSPASVDLLVADDGIGIFHKIRRAFDLQDERHAVLELSKGKLTTDPARHTGEGIFFTSRVFDSFLILSGALFLSHDQNRDSDWLLEHTEPFTGTVVRMAIDPETDRTLRDVFDRFTDVENGGYGFDVTHVPVALARHGDESLISRSQAKRLLARVNQFRRVVLDFDDVETIGQAFADEIFRVFRQANPAVDIRYVGANERVERMIQRALTKANDEQRGLF